MPGIPAPTGSIAQQAAPLPSPSPQPPAPSLLVEFGAWGCQQAPPLLRALVVTAEPCQGLVPLGQRCPTPCVLARPDLCLPPLRRNIYPFYWSCLLIKYLRRGLAVMGRAKSRDVASLSCSTGGSGGRGVVCGSVCPRAGEWQCHRVPHCNVGVSGPPGSPSGGKEGRGLPGGPPPPPGALSRLSSIALAVAEPQGAAMMKM